jgi:chaperonin GroES
MKIRPLRDRIIIERIDGEETSKGDRVLFSKYAGTEITQEGEGRLILREDDVLGVVQ